MINMTSSSSLSRCASFVDVIALIELGVVGVGDVGDGELGATNNG